MMTQQEALKVLARLAAAEHDQKAQLADLRVGPFSAYVLIACIQLVMRYPGGVGPTMGDALDQLRSQLLPMFPDGSPVREILDMGMNPECDIEVEETSMPVTCPKCGSSDGFHPGKDGGPGLLSCATCGHLTSVAEIVTQMSLMMPGPEEAQAEWNTELYEIPYRVGGENRSLACPVDDGTAWLFGTLNSDRAYRCADCGTIYSRDALQKMIEKVSGA